jgi:hypothetical protein
MEKITVTPEHYIDLLNEELKKHPDYSPDLEFVSFPEGARGKEITGYVLKNRQGRKVYEDVSRAVFLRYRLAE